MRFKFGNPWKHSDETHRDETGDLIRRARDGDREAFEEIAKRHEKRIFWFAYTVTGNLHDAEDVTQEVLIKIFKNIGRLRNEEKFTTWLYRITLHASWDFVREFHIGPGERKTSFTGTRQLHRPRTVSSEKKFGRPSCDISKGLPRMSGWFSCCETSRSLRSRKSPRS